MKKRILPLAIAGLLGLAATVMVHGYLRNQQQLYERRYQELTKDLRSPIEVIAAIKDVPEGTVLTKDHLGYITIPEKFVQPYATRNPNDVVGKVTLVPMAEGEQVLLNKVRRPEEVKKVERGLSALTPEGKRAVTIAVDQVTGVGGLVMPGDVVDVIWNFQAAAAPGTGPQDGQLVTVTLFQGIEVLAVDRQLRGQAPAEGAKERTSYMATLALDPQQAAMLLFAREQGRVQLSLRPKQEPGQAVAVAPTTMNSLTEAILGKSAAPEPPTVTERMVEVYKGLDRSVVAVSTSKEE